MKINFILYLIVAIQFVIAIAMWYVSITAMNNYETIWTVLLSLNLILMSLLFLVFLRHEGVFSRD
ncbi:MAG: hypothetical protein B2I17_09335 [Thermoplasmatales archaeon B_DKE]|nr:MAG: hypothetical protein B2I17_09335 [Thermoplasmatales archaeon B_DKE]QRF76112.1 hypothetical protein Thermo_01627 [Thermoplasmatales archaeon]